MNNFKYTPPKNTPVAIKELQNDLKQVAEKLNTNTLTQKLYSEYGKYDVTNLSRRFDIWCCEEITSLVVNAVQALQKIQVLNFMLTA